MIMPVIDVSERWITDGLVQGWRTHFPGSGHVIELRLNCSTTDRSTVLRKEWSRVFDPHTCFIDSHSQFPCLASYAVHFEADLDAKEAVQRLSLIGDAWGYHLCGSNCSASRPLQEPIQCQKLT
jgi:hypothetical protein